MENLKLKNAVKLIVGLDPAGDEFKAIMAQLLGKIDPNRPYGTVLFDALARLGWSIAFEAVALRINQETKKIEVFLRKRAADDTAYPGEWHAPGSVLRANERPGDVAKRLEKEFSAEIVGFSFVGDSFIKEARGPFNSKIYLVYFKTPPVENERHGWFPIDCLPEPMVEEHRNTIIPTAVHAFANNRSDYAKFATKMVAQI